MLRSLSRLLTGLVVSLTPATAAPLVAEQAFAVPRSDFVIKGQITFSDNTRAQVVIRDGLWATVQEQDGSRYLVLSPVIDDGTQRPRLMLLQVFQEPSGDESVSQLGEERVVPIGWSIRFTPINVRFEVRGIEAWSFPDIRPLPDAMRYFAPADMRIAYGLSRNGICCLAYGSRTVCANQVSYGDDTCDGGWTY